MTVSNAGTATDQAIAGAVRAELARRKVRQPFVRQATGWSTSFLARRLSGEVAFSASELLTLAHAIDADLMDLIPVQHGGRRTQKRAAA